MIRGETVILMDKVQTGVDPMGSPIYEEQEIPVDNVLVGNPAADPVIENDDMNGRRCAYVLGIPKKDAHDWRDKVVYIHGQRFRTYGPPLIQTEANLPKRLPWNAQIKVERYE